MDRHRFVIAWLLCGTLDILYAVATSLITGRNPLAMLRGIASGPFGPDAAEWGAAGSLAGLAVHFAIMAAMVAVGLALARKTPLGDVAPWKAGTLYGLVLYMVMYGVVLRWRFAIPFPTPDRIKLINEIVPHVFLVGIPMFYLFRRKPQPS